MPALHFYHADQEVLNVPFSGPLLKIGRHPSNDLTIPDQEISRFHAQIERREETIWIVDQSRNGTFVNGKRIKSSPLKDRDEIRLGGWRIVFLNDVVWGEQETAAERKKPSFPSFYGMIGKSEPMQKVFAMIEKVAPTATTVLILGETGTGKEIAARAIHELSPRKQRPFVPLNCGAISPQLIESELFGHERGAFTGAVSRHTGAFEQAHGGTLFLDEVGELPLELQPKLLRVLEEYRFRRVGGTEEIEANVRVVAATHRDLETMTREGKFREDLYFRLFSVPLSLPPLRERIGDIPILADHFLENFQPTTVEGATKRLSSEALKKLLDHSWPGNVRELKNVITRSLLFATGPIVGSDEILFLTKTTPLSRYSLENAEREAILTALRENGWNKKKTAVALGIAKSTLFHKLTEYQIKKP